MVCDFAKTLPGLEIGLGGYKPGMSVRGRNLGWLVEVLRALRIRGTHHPNLVL